MPEIKVRDTEYFEVALRRFKKLLKKAGTLTELRSRECYENQLQNVNAKWQLLLNATTKKSDHKCYLNAVIKIEKLRIS